MWPWRKYVITRTRDRVLVDTLLHSPVDVHQRRFRRRLAVAAAAVLAAVALLRWL